MASPRGVALAAHVVSSFYGDLCRKVCECLLRRGTLSLVQVVRFTELSRENVVNCLRVLIHQNCVQAFCIEQEGANGEATKNTLYMALFDNIIHKLRSLKFMHIVLEELGEDCRRIFYGLIQHGRLSLDQIIDKEKQKTGNFDVQIRDSFKRLLSARFVERCPAPAPSLSPHDAAEPPAKRRGAKSAKIAEERTIEQRALAAAAPTESIRFLMEMDNNSEEKEEENSKSPVLGGKRKKNVDSDEDVLDRKIEVLWRVNFEEFLRRVLHKACVSYVKTRINTEASIVLGAVLDLSGRPETRLLAEKSPYLSVNDIYDEVIKKDGGVGMDLDRVKTSLDQLGCQTIPTDIDENYSVDIKSIIRKAQNEEVESMILKRYGRDAYKIFRLLSKAGRFVETDKISEATFVEKKVTSKILFQLWKDDYLQMQGFMGSWNKLAAFYVWKVDEGHCRGRFLDEMYHAVLNLRLRITLEQDQRKEVLQLPNDRLDEKSRDKRNMWKIVRTTLERSLMDLDDAVVLFHHF